MYCVRMGYLGRGDDPRDVEVTLDGLGPAYADIFIGEFDVQGLPVGFRMNRDRCDT
jgi:hypothetical protein